MLDIHCHILPAIDDGPADREEALAVARLCVADGITHITATPHCHRYLRLLRADILPAVAAFNESLQQAGIPLLVLPGSETQVTDVAAYQRDFTSGVLCHLGDCPAFTLTEFPWNRSLFPADASQLIVWLRERGTTPIVAHPERHDYFRDDPDRLAALAAAGAWIQVTVDSLLGNHGPLAAVAADEMLGAYPEAVLATDTHNPRRCSGLSAGYKWTQKRYGSQRAVDLRERSDHILRTLLTYRDSTVTSNLPAVQPTAGARPNPSGD